MLRVIRIDNATRSLHAECPLYAADFVIGSVGLSSQTVCTDTPVTLEISTRLRALRACHHARTRNLGVNPWRQIALQGCPALASPREPRLRTRGGRFPCQPRMDPRSAALRDNKRGSRQTRTPENATCKCRRRPALARRRPSGALTDPPPPASTTVSRWPSWPCSLRSQRRRSRYLPFKPRTRSGAAVAREAAAPRSHS